MPPLAFLHGRNFGCRIREFVYRGHRCVSMENAAARVVIAADKGADIIEYLYKPLDVECLWHSRLGLRDDAHLRPSSPLAGGHFREHFPGGWYGMLPNGPEPCIHRGAEYGHHGEATLLPWDYRIERDDPDAISVAFTTRLVRIPLRVERVMHMTGDRGTLRIEERITNESGQPVEFLWGHHPTFGWPLVDAGTRIHLPAGTVVVGADVPAGARVAANQRTPWPHVRGVAGDDLDLSALPPATTVSHDFVRVEDFDDGWFAIVNPARRVGFSLRWDARVFPMLGIWQLWGGGADHPWYGMPHLLALEPACDLPSLAAASARGTACTLTGGASCATVLEASVFEGVTDVTHVGPDGDVR